MLPLWWLRHTISPAAAQVSACAPHTTGLAVDGEEWDLQLRRLRLRRAISPAAAAVSACAPHTAGLAVDGGEWALQLRRLRLQRAISPAAAAVSACAPGVVGLAMGGGEGVLPLLRILPAAAKVSSSIPIVAGGETARLLLLLRLLLRHITQTSGLRFVAAAPPHVIATPALAFNDGGDPALFVVFLIG